MSGATDSDVFRGEPDVQRPPISEASTAWFHHNVTLAPALHAAACWIAQHADDDGLVEDLIVNRHHVTKEGYASHGEAGGAIQRWTVGVVVAR